MALYSSLFFIIRMCSQSYATTKDFIILTKSNLLNVIMHNIQKLLNPVGFYNLKKLLSPVCVFKDFNWDIDWPSSNFLVSCYTCVQAMRSTQGSIKPIFISIGHMISLQTAIMIVQKTCKFRVPEPIRQVKLSSIWKHLMPA